MGESTGPDLIIKILSYVFRFFLMSGVSVKQWSINIVDNKSLHQPLIKVYKR
jgi:hypothetical protein